MDNRSLTQAVSVLLLFTYGIGVQLICYSRMLNQLQD